MDSTATVLDAADSGAFDITFARIFMTLVVAGSAYGIAHLTTALLERIAERFPAGAAAPNM